MFAMQMAPRQDLEQRYDDLTARQKAIVDAWSEHPDETNRNIAKERAPNIYNEQYKDPADDPLDELNESYVSQFTNKDGVDELIRYKQDIEQNQRQKGELKTEGDPFSAIPDEDNSWQTWDERPNKQPAQGRGQVSQERGGQATNQDQLQLRAPVAAQIKDETVHVVFDKSYFRQLLEGQSLPPELHKQLMDEVLSDLMS